MEEDGQQTSEVLKALLVTYLSMLVIENLETTAGFYSPLEDKIFPRITSLMFFECLFFFERTGDKDMSEKHLNFGICTTQKVFENAG